MNPAIAIVLTGALVASACALVGSFLVLRRMALLGDAISHSVLPGIVIAFLVTGSRSSIPMLIGAGAVGVLTVFLVERLHRSGRLYEDASIGVVFPALFALGVILVSRYAWQVDIDLDCVLYGEIAYVPWDVLTVAGADLGPRAIWVTGAVLAIDLVVVLLFYKELKLTSFDPALAAALGFSPVAVHYLLMSAVSVTVVGAFESVGAILVVAMLVVPPAAAYLWTRRLSTMLVLAVTFGVVSVVAGYLAARALDFSIAGGMAVAAGALFLVALVASPAQGLVALALRRRRLTLRLEGRLLLLHLDEDGTASPRDAVRRRLGWPPARLDRVAARVADRGWVVTEGDRLALSSEGRDLRRGPLADLVGHDVGGATET
jgi:manganese/zinc/iron transport system permease protein